MDPLHLKGIADLAKNQTAMSNDKFYELHSCDWLQWLRSAKRVMLFVTSLSFRKPHTAERVIKAYKT